MLYTYNIIICDTIMTAQIIVNVMNMKTHNLVFMFLLCAFHVCDATTYILELIHV